MVTNLCDIKYYNKLFIASLFASISPVRMEELCFSAHITYADINYLHSYYLL